MKSRSPWILALGCIVLALNSVNPGLARAGVGHDWPWANPRPQGMGLEDYSVVDSQVILAVGNGGMVLRTDDGGLNWRILPSGTTGWLLAVDFTDEMTGTIVGEVDIAGIILRTTDGGQTWQQQQTAEMPWLESVDFLDADTGVIVGWSGAIYWTTDGGANWIPQQSGTTERLYSVHLFDATTAVAVGNTGVICRTDDGGQTWDHPQSQSTARLEAVAFGNDDNGVAVGQSGTTIRTTNGGISWIPRPSGTGVWLMDVGFRDADTAVAVGGGTLIVSTDGGTNWNPLDPPAAEYWNGVDFNSEGGLLLTGGSGCLWQSDAAWSTWYNGQSGSTASLESIAKATSQIAVAVGRQGTLLRTTDAGLTWTEISSGTQVILRGVDFGDAETGLAVGNDGVILRTGDAGLTWQPVTTGETKDLWDVDCIDAEHAVAVGQDRTVLHTGDGGATWTEVGFPNGFDYSQAVFFVDEKHGWLCTFYGFVFHTTDGGLTWESQVSSFLDLQDIHFTDLLNGISVGGVDGNATLLTDDGGVTWIEQSNPENAYLNGVEFSDPLTGIAVGQGIFRTFDGAATWKRDFSFDIYFEDICLMGEGVALAVGRGGAILRAGPDGAGFVFPETPSAGIRVRAYPNPFNPRTTLAFFLPQTGNTQVRVFDLAGRNIRTLADRLFTAGDHAVVWDGRDHDGRNLPSGNYLIQIQTDGASLSQRVMLIR